jgi:hypothetical protein
MKKKYDEHTISLVDYHGTFWHPLLPANHNPLLPLPIMAKKNVTQKLWMRDTHTRRIFLPKKETFRTAGSKKEKGWVLNENLNSGQKVFLIFAT